MSLKCKRIHSFEEFRSLQPAWLEVVKATGQDSPFMSHDWFSCCWQAVQPEKKPEIIVVEDGGGPVAILPFMRSRSAVRGLPVRVLSLLECPDTPFLDLLIAGDQKKVIETFLRDQHGRSDWDIIRFQKIPVQSPVQKSLEAVLAGRNSWREAGRDLSPVLDLRGSWEEFYAAKTQRFRKTIRNIQNRLERAGALEVEEQRAVDPDSPFFAELLEVSRQSWKAEQGLAMATMPRMPEFFRELTRLASRNGWLRIWLLRLNGHAVATEYQIQANGVVHALRSDFAYGVREFSPGAYLNFRIVQGLFESGDVTRYDMGPGTNDYKLRWASGSQETTRLEIYRESFYGRLLRTIETKAVPMARKWRDRVQPEEAPEAVAS